MIVTLDYVTQLLFFLLLLWRDWKAKTKASQTLLQLGL